METSLPVNVNGVTVEATRLSRIFAGNVQAIHELSLVIPSGQFIAILGPSGCGKSTFLRLVAGLDRPTAGQIIVANEARQTAAYVFQDAHLLPWRNVLHNVVLPLELRGDNKIDRREKALAAIEQVGLLDAAKRYPAQLSGGMRMRVSLARAVVTDPHLLLLDEPFAALDEITRQRLDEQLRQLWLTRGMTVLFVTHSTAEAVYLADRAVVMSARPGKIVLDQHINLPRDRSAILRATPEFAEQTRDLFAALESGDRR